MTIAGRSKNFPDVALLENGWWLSSGWIANFNIVVMPLPTLMTILIYRKLANTSLLREQKKEEEKKGKGFFKSK